MTRSLHGTIHGKRIELDSETDIPEGSRVKLNVETLETLSDEEKLKRLKMLFGVWRDDKEIQQIFEDVERQRHEEFPRGVDFDAAS